MALENFKFSYIFFITIFLVNLTRFECAANESESDSGTYTKQIIDPSSPDTEVLKLFNTTNISQILAMRKQYLEEKNKQTVYSNDSPELMTETTTASTSTTRRHDERVIIQMIRNSIEQQITRNGSASPFIPNIEHDYVLHTICDPPKFTNASFWRDNETTWNLHFSPPTLLEGFTSTKSVLRLLKIIPVSEIAHATKTGDCSKDDEPLIRITISAYTKKNKKADRKKKLCSSFMVQRNFEGWVEFDVKPALKLWEKGNRNLGLAIDVQDQDMNPLSAATFFDPYNCQACEERKPIPWDAYKDNITIDYPQLETLPRCPRVDYKLKPRQSSRDQNSSDESTETKVHKKRHQNHRKIHRNSSTSVEN